MSSSMFTSAPPSTSRRRRRTAHDRLLRRGLVVLAVGALTVSLAPSAASGAESGASDVYGGVAYASTVVLGGTGHGGTTAMVPMCTMDVPSQNTGQAARQTLTGVGYIGAATTNTASGDSGAATASTSKTDVGPTSLFASAVHFDAVSTVARVARNATGYTMTADTQFQGLTIAGQPVASQPAPNTTIPVPGIGSVIVNAQSHKADSEAHTITVTALKLVAGSGNATGVTPAKILVGRALAMMHSPINAVPTGTSYGTRIANGASVVVAATAPATLPCGGTDGTVTANSALSPALATAGTAHAVNTHARSTDSGSSTIATTNSQIDALNLFGGTVTAKQVTARAQVRRTGSRLTRSSGGTLFENLVVNGQPYDGTPEPNTVMQLPGLGTLYLHRVVNTPDGVKVAGIQIVLNQAQGSLPAGTTITAGYAAANVANG